MYKSHNNIKKIFVCLLIITICFQLTGVEAFAKEVKSNDVVTRLEWLKALTSTFDFMVEEDNYPDNYYSDLDVNSSDYYDIMLATEFGLLDVQAGEALRPNDAVTREFAAHTLNLCMGYVLEENTYTFVESETVTYPEDIQVAIHQGWFVLSNGKFFPEQAVTKEEKNLMITAAREALAKDKNLSGNNSYQYKSGVIVLPEETEICFEEEERFVITDCPAEIKAGDIFGQIYDGIPLAWKAVSVEKAGSDLVIVIDGVNQEEVFEEIDVAGEIKVDLAKLQPASKDASLTYVVGGTKESNYEDGRICKDLEEVGTQKITAVIVEQVIDMPEDYADFKAADPKIKINAKITNVKQKHGCTRRDAYIDFDFKVDLNCNVNVDILEAAGVSPSYELFYLSGLGIVACSSGKF